MPHPFRSEKVFQDYEEVKASGILKVQCNLCKKAESIKEFKHWRIVNNKYPYDRIAKIHHMIIPKRHTAYNGLTQEEKDELDLIKNTDIHQEYEAILEATDKTKSIPAHFHLHLMTYKELDLISFAGETQP